MKKGENFFLKKLLFYLIYTLIIKEKVDFLWKLYAIVPNLTILFWTTRGEHKNKK